MYLDAFEIILLFTPRFFSSHASSADGPNQFLSVLQLKEWIIIYSQMLIILSFIFIPNFFFLFPHVYICIKTLQKIVVDLFNYFCLTNEAKYFFCSLYGQEDWP